MGFFLKFCIDMTATEFCTYELLFNPFNVR
jgi:hypothetical protein